MGWTDEKRLASGADMRLLYREVGGEEVASVVGVSGVMTGVPDGGGRLLNLTRPEPEMGLAPAHRDTESPCRTGPVSGGLMPVMGVPGGAVRVRDPVLVPEPVRVTPRSVVPVPVVVRPTFSIRPPVVLCGKNSATLSATARENWRAMSSGVPVPEFLSIMMAGERVELGRVQMTLV